MKKILAFVASLTAVCALMCGCSQRSDKEPLEGYEKISMHASWSYAYDGVKGLCKTDELDLIARVKIGNSEQQNRNGLLMTVFTANVKDLIYGNAEDVVNVIMTGGIDHDSKTIYEISDDPLMQKDDEFIIFAHKNESGTYTVLGGPQGRFVIDNDNVFPLVDHCSQSNTAKVQTAEKGDGKTISDFVEEIKSYI